MKTILNRLVEESQAFTAFADRHELVLEINERHTSDPRMRFYANFKYVEEMSDGCLLGTFGNGRTPKEAIDAYKTILEGKQIAYRAGSAQRKNIQCPKKWS